MSEEPKLVSRVAPATISAVATPTNTSAMADTGTDTGTSSKPHRVHHDYTVSARPPRPRHADRTRPVHRRILRNLELHNNDKLHDQRIAADVSPGAARVRRLGGVATSQASDPIVC